MEATTEKTDNVTYTGYNDDDESRVQCQPCTQKRCRQRRIQPRNEVNREMRRTERRAVAGHMQKARKCGSTRQTFVASDKNTKEETGDEAHL